MIERRPAISRLLYTTVESPLGELLLLGDGHALRGLYMQDGRKPVEIAQEWQHASAPFADASSQLADYFTGVRRVFELQLAVSGTPFELRVWRALQDIPYGQTESYGELAARVGAPAAAREVGSANGRNPISLIVPCHRVIGADGALTGYGGGLERKRMLLDLERGQTWLGAACS
jgi:methylated-DNA-[protein]-cysteine S-methyltransferase